MNYGKAIKKLRTDRAKQNQSEFAKSVGITQTYLSQIENGKKKPSTDLLEKICECGDANMSFLVWFSIEESDIQENKKSAWKELKPLTDALIEHYSVRNNAIEK